MNKFNFKKLDCPEHIKHQFKYCPFCGEKDSLIFDNIKIFNCSKCGRSYFVNPSSAVGIIVDTPKGIVFVLRKFEPKKGYIVMPGGFCEPYERIEYAIKRELFEETAIKLDKVNFLMSGSNEYIYEKMMYVTSDIYFYAKLDYVPKVKPSDDALEVVFIEKENIDFNKIAFESSKEALNFYFENILKN